jgi:hypothetical protein
VFLNMRKDNTSPLTPLQQSWRREPWWKALFLQQEATRSFQHNDGAGEKQ